MVCSKINIWWVFQTCRILIFIEFVVPFSALNVRFNVYFFMQNKKMRICLPIPNMFLLCDGFSFRFSKNELCFSFFTQFPLNWAMKHRKAISKKEKSFNKFSVFRMKISFYLLFSMHVSAENISNEGDWLPCLRIKKCCLKNFLFFFDFLDMKYLENLLYGKKFQSNLRSNFNDERL